MKRTHRLRRVTAAAVLGMGMTAGVIGVTVGIAGANTADKIVGTTSPAITSNNSTQTAGVVTVSLAGAATYVANDKLTVTAVPPSGTLTWKTKPKVVLHTGKSGTNATPTTTTIAAATVSVSTDTATAKLPAIATTKTTVTVKFETNSYKVTGSKAGNDKLQAQLKTTAGLTVIANTSFATHTTAHNATISLLAGPSAGNGITASSAPKVAKTGTTQAAGTLTVTLRGTAATNATATHLNLTAKPGTGGHVKWNSATVSGTGVTAVMSSTATHAPLATTVTANTTHDQVSITIGDLATGKSATVHVTGIKYNTIAAVGTVTVTPKWVNNVTNSTATVTYGTFTPTSAANAVATHTTPPTAPTESFHATSTPSLKPTGTGQAAGTWTIKFTGTKNHGWAKTQTFSINVFEHTGDNCTVTSHGYVLFTGVPKATVSGAKNVSTTPTVKVTTSAATHCSAASHNQVTITFTNTGTFTSTTALTNTFSIVVSAVKFNSHKGTSQTYGTLDVGATKTTGGTIAALTTKATGGPSNANIAAVVMSGNTPAVTVAKSAFDAPISPVNVIEQVAGSIPSSDYVCVTLKSATNHFNAANTATASVKSGNGVVTKTVTYYTGGTKETSGTATTAVFKVKTASSTTKPSTYKVTGLHVNAAAASGTVLAVGTYSATAHCGAAGVTGTPAGTAVAFVISVPTSKRIAGTTAAATAAAQLEYQYKATGAAASCPGNTNTTTPGFTKRAVILANGTHFPDALSSQYLAGRLHTGTLLAAGTFGGTSVPQVSLNALRLEGISHVYVIGGPLAVTTAAVNMLKTTPQYTCGGSSVRHTSTGATRFLTVTRIGGATQYTTAEMVATFLAKSNVGSGNFAPAFAGVNKTGGNGKFNDTKGNASPAGINATQKTAVVADGQVFQDAMSAGAFAYANGYPVLLTTPSKLSPQVASAISALTVTQVIVMGGQLAVSDTVVTSLEADGVSVLRIGGADYTDTAVQAADFEIAATGTGGLGWTPAAHTSTAAVARGNGFSDGLAGAVITGSHHWALLLTESPTSTGSYLTAFLKNAGAKGFGVDETKTTSPHASATYRLSAVVIFGGTLAITPTVVKTLQTDLSTG